MALIAVALLVATGVAGAKDKIQQSFDLPATIEVSVLTQDCNTSPGPRVTLDGSLSLAPLDVDVIFSHVTGFDPQQQFAVEKTVVPVGQPPIQQPQAQVVGAVGSNPFMWIQLRDVKGQPLTSEIFLGQCSQGPFNPTIEALLPVSADGQITATDCNVPSGPRVALNGQIEASPIMAEVILRDDLSQGGGKKAVFEALLVPTSPTIQLPQEEAQAGVGGNPRISTQFKLADGTLIGAEAQYGRCTSVQQP